MGSSMGALNPIQEGGSAKPDIIWAYRQTVKEPGQKIRVLLALKNDERGREAVSILPIRIK